MLKVLTISSFVLLQTTLVSSIFAEEIPAKSIAIPIVERAFVDAINGFDKNNVVQIKIADIVGKEIYSSSHSSQLISMNVEGINRGLYLVNIIQGLKIIHKKIIIN